jgi:hypothetical protein
VTPGRQQFSIGRLQLGLDNFQWICNTGCNSTSDTSRENSVKQDEKYVCMCGKKNSKSQTTFDSHFKRFEFFFLFLVGSLEGFHLTGWHVLDDRYCSTPTSLINVSDPDWLDPISLSRDQLHRIRRLCGRQRSIPSRDDCHSVKMRFDARETT